MKICAAQTRSIRGDISANIEHHLRFIDEAIKHGVSLIVFPELSITNYERALGVELAFLPGDARLDVFQQKSDAHTIIIYAGLPVRSEKGVHISLAIFQPNQPRQIYSKQFLHGDESKFFVTGEHESWVKWNDEKIAPAICYESTLPGHAAKASRAGATIYIASVANSQNGVKKAFDHYPLIAKQHRMFVLMANCLGPGDDFTGAGQSATWNREGMLQGQLNATEEGLLITETRTGETIAIAL